MPPPAQSGGSPTASDTPSLPPLPGTTRLPNGDLLSIDNIDFASDDDDDGDYHTGEDDDDDEEDEVEYGAGRDGWTLDDMLEEAEAMEELEAAFGLGGGGDDEDDHEMADSAEDDEEEDDGQGVAPLGGFQGSMHDLVQGLQNGTAPPALLAQLRELMTRSGNSGGPQQITILRNPLTGVLSLSMGADDDDDLDDDDDFDDDDYVDGPAVPRSAAAPRTFYPERTEPAEAGLRLRYGGDFGPVGRQAQGGLARARGRFVGDMIWQRESGGGVRRGGWRDVAKSLVPNTPGTIVANLTAPPYCGQYSSDSSFFYTATKDFRLTIFATDASTDKRPPPPPPRPSRRAVRRGYHGQLMEYDVDDDGEAGLYAGAGRVGESSAPIVKNLAGGGNGWTVTDADLAVGDEWMIYSSLTPVVRMFNTREQDSETVPLDFSAPFPGERYRTAEYMRVWSVRFSADGREIVAGASADNHSDLEGKIVVYDLEKNAPTLSIDAHRDDVNSVCWADKASKHILCSASDDGYVKIWDRRSLSSGKPSGVLVGHTEGITCVSPKGDGRYILSNGKDQTARLFDLRSMSPASVTNSTPSAAHRWGTGWDYRMDPYRRPRFQAAPGDNSIMQYRGHSVCRTLIRAHFAPDNSTGHAYVYSGSADGRVHVWNLDGTVVQRLDRRLTAPLVDVDREGVYMDPSAAEGARARVGGNAGRSAYCVRDVAWHSFKPEMMTSAWEPSTRGDRGSVAKHEWKGFGKHGMTIEDVLERERMDATTSF